jgi:hypothetical protein
MNERNGAGSLASFAYDEQPGIGLEQPTQAIPKNGMTVGDNDPDAWNRTKHGIAARPTGLPVSGMNEESACHYLEEMDSVT